MTPRGPLVLCLTNTEWPEAHEESNSETLETAGDSSIPTQVSCKVIDTTLPGGILGEMALVDDLPRSATAVAKTACKVVPVNERQFNFMVQETPIFAITEMRIMCDPLGETLPGVVSPAQSLTMLRESSKQALYASLACRIGVRCIADYRRVLKIAGDASPITSRAARRQIRNDRAAGRFARPPRRVRPRRPTGHNPPAAGEWPCSGRAASRDRNSSA